MYKMCKMYKMTTHLRETRRNTFTYHVSRIFGMANNGGRHGADCGATWFGVSTPFSVCWHTEKGVETVNHVALQSEGGIPFGLGLIGFLLTTEFWLLELLGQHNFVRVCVTISKDEADSKA